MENGADGYLSIRSVISLKVACNASSDKMMQEAASCLQATGGCGEGRIAENGDKQAVATDDMEFLFGDGIQGIGSLNETVGRVDYFTSLFTQMHDVTSQLNDVMKPITQKTKTYQIRVWRDLIR